MGIKKVPAKIQGIVWAFCIIAVATVWILEITGVFGERKIFGNFGFWQWVLLVGGIIGIASVILYGFGLIQMLLTVTSVLYFLTYFAVIKIAFWKLMIPAAVAVVGIYILVLALKGKRSFREIKKDPEYVRASDLDKERERQQKNNDN